MKIYAMLLLWMCATFSWAHPETTVETSQSVQWFQGDKWQAGSSLRHHLHSLKPKDEFALTGGKQVSFFRFTVRQPQRYVIDFRNSTLIGHFQHVLFDGGEQPIQVFTGGILEQEANPYFLRHGRMVELIPGDYSLLTFQQSQFNIAPPTPFIMPEAEYIQEIKAGNSITLLGLGIFASLFFYYLVLSITRRSRVDLAYALFILGNLLFNATSLLFLSDVLGVTWFTGASWPILLSNIAYVIFVLALLGITRLQHPWLWWSGFAIVVLFSTFFIASFFLPNFQNEFNRLGVAIFLCFGLCSGLVLSWQKNIVARWYLLANLGFFILAMIAISQEQIAGVTTIYMSHIGLIAVACEVLLLSCVVAYQMTRIEHERHEALQRSELHLQLAHRDPLTQLPNRYAMEERLQTASESESFIYIDLDGLKQCNDCYGHKVGDKLLVSFASHLAKALPKEAMLFRISGDEFGLFYATAIQGHVEHALISVETKLKKEFSSFCGISYGIAEFSQYMNYHDTVQQADERMYINKRKRKAANG